MTGPRSPVRFRVPAAGFLLALSAVWLGREVFVQPTARRREMISYLTDRDFQ
jgi:hypothetical protein